MATKQPAASAAVTLERISESILWLRGLMKPLTPGRKRPIGFAPWDE